METSGNWSTAPNPVNTPTNQLDTIRCDTTQVCLGVGSINLAIRNSVQGYLAHKKKTLLGPCRRTIPRVLWWSQEGGLFLMSEVLRYAQKYKPGRERKTTFKTRRGCGLSSTGFLLSEFVGGGVRIHPENARMSGRHGVQYVAQFVACAALTPVVWQ